jgi:hypothetical protein
MVRAGRVNGFLFLKNMALFVGPVISAEPWQEPVIKGNETKLRWQLGMRLMKIKGRQRRYLICDHNTKVPTSAF